MKRLFQVAALFLPENPDEWEKFALWGVLYVVLNFYAEAGWAFLWAMAAIFIGTAVRVIATVIREAVKSTGENKT